MPSSRGHTGSLQTFTKVTQRLDTADRSRENTGTFSESPPPRCPELHDVCPTTQVLKALRMVITDSHCPCPTLTISLCAVCLYKPSEAQPSPQLSRQLKAVLPSRLVLSHRPDLPFHSSVGSMLLFVMSVCLALGVEELIISRLCPHKAAAKCLPSCASSRAQS